MIQPTNVLLNNMEQTADVIFGLAFGDEGKGQTVCTTAHKRYKQTGIVPAVVRYSGGCQNEHNVVWQFGSVFGPEFHHKHSQIGAVGPLAFRSETYTWKAVPVDICGLIREITALYNLQAREDWKTTKVYEFGSILKNQYMHEDCLWVAPFHSEVSRIRETNVKHGSTGRGIFEVNKFAEIFPDKALKLKDMMELLHGGQVDSVREKINAFLSWSKQGMEHLDGKHTLKERNDKLEVISADDAIKQFKQWIAKFISTDELALLNRCIITEEEMLRRMKKCRHLVFEGGQGVMLDMDFGFFPNVTFSHAVPITAKSIINQLGIQESSTEFIGVTRYYGTRHGAGYIPYELGSKSKDYKLLNSNEPHNGYTFAGGFRFAGLSIDLLVYAMNAVKLQGIKMDRIHWTHADIEWAQRAQANIVDPYGAANTALLAHQNINKDIERRPLINEWMHRLKRNTSSEKTPFDMAHSLSGIMKKSEGCRVENFDLSVLTI